MKNEQQGPQECGVGKRSPPRWVVQLLTFALCVVAGVGTFTVIFFGPAWYYGNDDVLLAWGWVGTPVGMISGFLASVLTAAKGPRLIRKLLRGSS
jgi:hypothetical protein